MSKNADWKSSTKTSKLPTKAQPANSEEVPTMNNKIHNTAIA